MRLLKKITMMMIVYWYLFSNHYTRECIHTGESELAFDDLRVAGDALVIVAIIAKAAPAVLAAVSDGRRLPLRRGLDKEHHLGRTRA